MAKFDDKTGQSLSHSMDSHIQSLICIEILFLSEQDSFTLLELYNTV